MAEPTDGQVTAFVALMDTFCLLKGWSLPINEMPTPRPVHPTETTTSSDPHAPRHTLTHPSLSLNHHLDAQTAELATEKTLRARIDALATFPVLVAATSTRLLDQFTQQAPPQSALLAFPTFPLTNQLVVLRWAQHTRALPRAWKVDVVVTLMPNGLPDQLTEVRIAEAYGWVEAQGVLERATCSWQSRAAGHPLGYETGPWVYQTVREGRVWNPPHALNTATDYGAMIALLSQEVGVCIWHATIYEEMHKRRAEADELKDRRCENPEDEPRDSDGDLLSDPEFEDGCLGMGEWDLGLEEGGSEL